MLVIFFLLSKGIFINELEGGDRTKAMKRLRVLPLEEKVFMLQASSSLLFVFSVSIENVVGSRHWHSIFAFHHNTFSGAEFVFSFILLVLMNYLVIFVLVCQH